MSFYSFKFLGTDWVFFLFLSAILEGAFLCQDAEVIERRSEARQVRLWTPSRHGHS